MKTIIKLLFVAVLTTGITVAANAQKHSGKYEVSTQLKESRGSYDQRKLYREFLSEYMKNCPYISNFSIHEAIGSADNHNIVWKYDVNGWDDITKFYGWISEQIKSKQDNGLMKAMTPYEPDYAIGGQIHLEKRSKASLAKD
jgi:hypothetical protein